MSWWSSKHAVLVLVLVLVLVGSAVVVGVPGPRAPAVSDAPIAYDFARVDGKVAQLLETYGVEGASMKVARHGEVIYERHWGGFTEQTALTVGSASKWMSVAVMMTLIEDGTLALDTTVGTYFPEFAPEQQAITLAQLLSHTSGLKRRTDCVNDYGMPLQDCVGVIAAEDARAPPGTEFRYGGVSVHVAAGMAERATGRPWRELFRERLVEPLGLQETQYGLHGVSPNPGVAGNIHTSSRDMLRFLQMLLDRGEIDGGRVLSEGSVALMEAGQTGDVRREGHLPRRHVRTPHDLYGFGAWRDVVDRDGQAVVLSAPGKFGTAPWIDRELDVAGIFLVEIKNGGDVAAARPDPAGIQYVVCDVIDVAERGPRPEGSGANPRCGIQHRRDAAAQAPDDAP